MAIVAQWRMVNCKYFGPSVAYTEIMKLLVYQRLLYFYYFESQTALQCDCCISLIADSVKSFQNLIIFILQ